MDIDLRIFRQHSKHAQPNGQYYYDTLQFQHSKCVKAEVGQHIIKTDWKDVPIFENKRFEVNE
jgi:hypothetical protein